MNYFIVEANLHLDNGEHLYFKKGDIRMWTSDIKKVKKFKSRHSAVQYAMHNYRSYGLDPFSYKITEL